MKKTQDEISKYLGITRQTYSKIEKWTTEITLGQAVKLSEILHFELWDFFSDTWTRASKEIDWEKYKQIIKFFIDAWTFGRSYAITKTKLAKLCYLADFTWYYYNLESMTWLDYRCIQQGPVPDVFFTIIEEMIDSEEISLNVEGKAFLIKNITPVSTNVLSFEEKSLIHKIAVKWRDWNTKDIVDFTHNQLPWSMCNKKEIIPYNLITQEDVNNLY